MNEHPQTTQITQISLLSSEERQEKACGEFLLGNVFFKEICAIRVADGWYFLRHLAESA